MYRPIKTALSLSMIAAFTGCAVLRPYQTIDVKGADAKDESAHCPTPSAPTPIEGAINRAKCMQSRFAEAAVAHSDFAAGAGVGLIALSGVVGYKSYVNHNPHNAAALGALGFVGATSATYLYGKREEIYFNGVQAINCAIDVVTPLDIDETRKELIRGVVSQTVAARSDFQRALVSFRNEVDETDMFCHLNSAKDRELTQVNALRAQLSSLEAENETLDASFTSVSRATGLLGDGSATAEKLDRAVERIRAEINIQLTTLQPDLAALTAKLTNLTLPAAATATATDSAAVEAAGKRHLFTTIFDQEREPATCSTKLSGLSHRASELNHLAYVWKESIVGLNQVLASLPSTQEQEKLLDGCSLGSSRAALKVAAIDGTLFVAKTGTAQATIVGGYPPYASVLSNPPDDAKSVVVSIDSDGQTLVVKTKDAKAATYAVVVSDKVGASAKTSVKVTE